MVIYYCNFCMKEIPKNEVTHILRQDVKGVKTTRHACPSCDKAIEDFASKLSHTDKTPNIPAKEVTSMEASEELVPEIKGALVTKSSGGRIYITDECKSEIYALADKGINASKISKQLGLKYQTVYALLKRRSATEDSVAPSNTVGLCSDEDYKEIVSIVHDVKKVYALHKAGWQATSIAEEFDVSVYYIEQILARKKV